MVGVGSDISTDVGVDKGVGRGGRKGDGRGDLLYRLDLVLQRRGIGRAAGERGAVGRSRVDGVQLQNQNVNNEQIREIALLLLPMFLSLADCRSPLTAGSCFDQGRART
jgi:hypothetical protein